MANGPNAQGFEYYRYDPSMAAAILFAILFALTTIVHLYQFVQTRTWIMIPMLVGGLFEWIGYIGRAVSANQTPNWTQGAYIVQVLFILIAPALFAATIYMELGRIIALCDGAHHSLIKLRWLTKIFVAGDVLSFLMQAGGAGLTAKKSASAVKNGQHIITGGLFVQVIFFAFFLVVAIVFHRRANKKPTSLSESPEIPWRKHLRILYLASALILVRSLLRLEEYAEGTTGFVLSHEYFLYIFDSVLMLCVMILFNLVHPSE
ncbi:RTA1 like protein-domain-containing protein [Usnea florida]